MSTRKAVASYAIDAPRKEKIKSLKQGVIDAAVELVELGAGLSEIEMALDEAIDAAECQIEDRAFE